MYHGLAKLEVVPGGLEVTKRRLKPVGSRRTVQIAGDMAAADPNAKLQEKYVISLDKKWDQKLRQILDKKWCF